MKKIIPPVLVLLCVAVMFGLNRFLPLTHLLFYPFNLIGLIFLVMGLAMTGWVRNRFAQAKTEIHTFKQPRQLVTDGLFQFSRNPIYLGFGLLLIGVWLLLGSFSPLLLVFAFFLIANFWYIPYEEKIMQQTFGESFVHYKNKVRRWV